MKIADKILMCSAFALLIGGSAFAQANEQTGGNKDPSGYGAWDTNADNQLEEDEFSTGLKNEDFYSQWDTNSDSQLDENEWNEGFRSQYGNLEQDSAYSNRNGNSDNLPDDDESLNGSFEKWDQDGSGYIDMEEFDAWNRKRAENR